MRRWSLHFALAALSSFAAVSTTALPAVASGAVVLPAGQADPAFVDVRTALSTTEASTTRWSVLTLPAGSRALWLVPVRPGATVDWASDRWFDALEEATTPRVLAPNETSPCPTQTTPETTTPWTTVGARQPAAALTVQASAAAAIDDAAHRGYPVSKALADALAAHYASGWNVVTVELAAGASASSTATVRVSDDGGAILPLALSSGMRITTWAIGSGRADIHGSRDVDPALVSWGELGSNYGSWRREVAGHGGVWLRESSSHDVLVDGTPILGALRTRSVVAGYFIDPSCASNPSQPCGEQTDLAVALGGGRLENTFVTRFVSSIPDGVFGTNVAVTFAAGAERGPVIRAGAFDTCAPPPSTPPVSTTSPPTVSVSSGGSGSSSVDSATYIPVPEGCGSSSEPSDDSSDSTDDASDSCTSSNKSSSSDGWDNSDSNDGCGSDDSSSSSDSCSGSSKTPDSGKDDDGWDTEDNNARPKTHAMGPKRRRSSPASRYALLAVAILLPFRRRARPTFDGDHR